MNYRKCNKRSNIHVLQAGIMNQKFSKSKLNLRENEKKWVAIPHKMVKTKTCARDVYVNDKCARDTDEEGKFTHNLVTVKTYRKLTDFKFRFSIFKFENIFSFSLCFSIWI